MEEVNGPDHAGGPLPPSDRLSSVVGVARTDVGLEITMTEYGGQIVCLLAPRPYSDLISVRIDVDSLIDKLRLGQVDRWLRPARHSSTDLAVCVTNDHVYIELSGRIIVGKSLHETPGAVSKAADSGQVMLLLVDQGGESSSDLIRKYAGRRRCWGSIVPVIDSRSAESTSMPSRYSFIGPTGEAVSRALGLPSTYVLDSNVLIDMERGYVGRLTSNQLEGVRVAVSHMLFEEVIPGFAIGELMSPIVPKNEENSTKWSQFEEVLNFWLSFGSRAISNVNEIGPRDVRKQIAPVSPVKPFLAGFGARFLDPLLAAVLKLDDLRRSILPRFNAQNRLDLFREYTSWAEETLRFSSGHLTAVAFDTFLAPHYDYLYKLMKFPAPNQSVDPDKRLRNLHGAAWDLHHLRVLDMYTNASGRSTTPYLVTADAALPEIYARLHRIGPQVQQGHSELGVQAVEFYSRLDDRFSHKHEGSFMEMQEANMDRTMDRIAEQIATGNVDDGRAREWAIVREQQIDVYWDRHGRQPKV